MPSAAPARRRIASRPGGARDRRWWGDCALWWLLAAGIAGGLRPFEHGLEVRELDRPAAVDYLKHGASWLEAVVHDGQLDLVSGRLDVERDLRARLGGRGRDDLVAKLGARDQLRRDGGERVG